MYYNPKNLKFAKNMRSHMTDEETKIWNLVRAKRFNGYKFKRQALIGEYIVDFLCPERKLIIEIDGGQHNSDENVLSDEKRTQYLNSCGYKVIRFWNNEVDNNIEGVYEIIKKNLEE